MPALGNALDFSKYEARNLRAHQLGTAPSSPVTGQLYYNTADNTLYWWNGTIWVSASGGAPSGAAGGDLSGTYPNPQIAAGAIVDADVNATANIATTKLNPNPLARANHTGTQLASTISDFNAAADARPLSAHAAATGSVNVGGQKLISVADPTAATDGANKQYVDGVAQGLEAKQSVRVASTANIAIPPGGTTLTIDGIALANGDRVLLKDQATSAANGIYTVGGIGTSVTLTRATDADVWTELISAYAWVEVGTANADSGWLCTVDQGGTLGTTAVTWVQFSGAGQVTAGAGLTKTGNTLDVGAGTGISVAADTVSVNGAIIPRYYSSATHGAGTTITISQATHGCRGAKGLVVQVQDEATGNVVLPDISVNDTGTVTVTFGASQAANTMRVTVIG